MFAARNVIKYWMYDVLDAARNQYDLIICDCPPGLSLLAEAAIAAANVIVVPQVPDRLSTQGLQLYAKYLKEDLELSHIAERTGVFINRMDEQTLVARQYAEAIRREAGNAEFPYSVFDTEFGDAVAYKRAMDRSREASQRKPSRTVQAEIDAKKLQPFYARSQKCSDVTVDDSRAKCAELFALDAQLSAAKKAEETQSRVERVATKLRPANAPDSIDPQAENILAVAALALPIRSDAVKETGMAVNAWWSICIELMAALMPGLVAFLAGSSAADTQSQPQTRTQKKPKPTAKEAEPAPIETPKGTPDPIGQWIDDRIRETKYGAVGFALLLENCNQWMDERCLPQVSDTMLGWRLGEMGFKKAKVYGKMQYVGIRLEGLKPALKAVS